MAAHLHEEEQVELIKRFWKRYGVAIIVMIILVAVGMGGWRFWQAQKRNNIDQASAMYQMVVYQAEKHQMHLLDVKTDSLVKAYPQSVYAALAQLLRAKFWVQQGKLQQASQDLQWVRDHSDIDALQAAATVRLARITLAEKHPKKALHLLAKPKQGFTAEYLAVQGQAYAELQQYPEAKQAYQQALAGLKKTDPLYELVKIQLYALPMS